LVIPAMVIVRGDKAGRAVGICVAGVAIAAAVYFASNPYVGIHLIGDRRVLVSNLGNSGAMYKFGASADWIRLLAIGMGMPLAIAGVLGLLVIRWRGAGWILALPAIAALVLFIAGAAGKPGEYARFGLVPDIGLMIAAVCAVGRLAKRPALQATAGIALIVLTSIYSLPYERGFLRDASDTNSRTMAADRLNQILAQTPSGKTAMLGVYAEPAPYCLPPVDLFRWKLVLLPPGGNSIGMSATVMPDERVNVWDANSAPMSWADKKFVISF
jgi:hypothetical protein